MSFLAVIMICVVYGLYCKAVKESKEHKAYLASKPTYENAKGVELVPGQYEEELQSEFSDDQ